MKKFVTLVFLSVVFVFTSQAQTPFSKDSLSVSSIVKFHQQVDFDNYQVKFKKLVSDSRCPKDVMCIRAGEAKVLLSIYKKGQFVQDKEIIIDASGYVIEENNLAFNAEDFKIYAMALKPYPKTTDGVPEKDYVLEIVFQPKRI